MKKGESETKVLRSMEDLGNTALWLAGFTPRPDHPITVMISMDDESRSLKQNRLAFSWYKYRGMMTHNGMHHERALCKLTYGVPLLTIADKDFNAFWHKAAKWMPYEGLLDSMEYIPVTRLMGVKMFAEYLTTIDEQSAAEGIVLPKPEDLYWEALMKESER